MQSPRPTRALALALGVCLAAAALRLLRAVLRWDEVSWLYSAYPGSTVDKLADGAIVDALTGFTGLHPPLWPLLHGVTELVAPVPALWLLFGALCSLGAVVLVTRHDLLAGLVLATAPVQLHYAAEVNNYPLLALGIAALWVLRARVAAGGPRWPLVLVAALVAWTHALGGFVACVVGLTLGRRGWPVLVAVGVAVAPLLPGLQLLAGSDATFRQPPVKLGLVVEDLVDRFGVLAALLLPVAALGARRVPALAAGLVATLVCILGLQLAGVAAPHQFPYLVTLGAPLAMLVAAGAQGVWSRRLVVAVAVLQGLWVGGFDLVRLGQIQADPAPRAIDLALAGLTTPWTCADQETPHPGCSGDAVYLLAPAGLNDDDKRRTSAVLWRLPPWQPMPRVWPYPAAQSSHRHGQPRLVDGHVVYVNDNPRPEISEAVAAHARVFVVVYEQGQRAGFTTELAARLGVAPEEIGGDHLYRLTP